VVAGTWSIYWNGLTDGARPRPSAWTARTVEILAGHLAGWNEPPPPPTTTPPSSSYRRCH